MFKVNDEETRTKSSVLVFLPLTLNLICTIFWCSYDCWLEGCICLWVYASPTNHDNVETAVHNCSTEMLSKLFWETLTKTFLTEKHQINYYLHAIIILTGKQHILRKFQYTQKVWILKFLYKNQSLCESVQIRSFFLFRNFPYSDWVRRFKE